MIKARAEKKKTHFVKEMQFSWKCEYIKAYRLM